MQTCTHIRNTSTHLHTRTHTHTHTPAHPHAHAHAHTNTRKMFSLSFSLRLLDSKNLVALRLLHRRFAITLCGVDSVVCKSTFLM